MVKYYTSPLADLFGLTFDTNKSNKITKRTTSPIVQWLSLQPKGWWVLSSNVGTGSKPEQVCKAQWAGERSLT